MATTAESTIVAVFQDSATAQKAADQLRSAGISSDRIFVSSQGSASGAGYSGSTTTQTAHHEGGISGWFKSLFSDDEGTNDRSRYESAVSGGRTIVSVEARSSEEDQVIDILDRYAPMDIHSEDSGAQGVGTSNTGNAGYQGSADAVGTAAGIAGTTAGVTGSAAGTGRGSRTGATAGDIQAIPVVEEDLQVGKRAVQRGGVRVYSRVTERPVEENIQLREEHVRVERQPVNRPATEADLRAGQDQVIEVQEYAEEAVVAKQARVVEEVRVGKEATERTETIRDSVRRTDVEVENLGEGTETYSGDDDFRTHFASTYGSTSGASYGDYAPAYQYGSQIAADPRYKGRNWTDVQSDLQRDYSSRYPNSTWEKMKDSVRYGWDKVTGKASSATSSSR